MDRKVTDCDDERELNVLVLCLWLEVDCDGRSNDVGHSPAPMFMPASVNT